MNTRVSLEDKERFIELRANGYSIRRIATEISRDTGTVTRLERELEEEVAAAKALQLESLYERFYLLKEAKITLLGETLTKLYGELEKRDLADVPTKDLLLLIGKYMEALEKEYIPPRIQTGEEIAAAKADRTLLNMLTAPLD